MCVIKINKRFYSAFESEYDFVEKEPSKLTSQEIFDLELKVDILFQETEDFVKQVSNIYVNLKDSLEIFDPQTGSFNLQNKATAKDLFNLSKIESCLDDLVGLIYEISCLKAKVDSNTFSAFYSVYKLGVEIKIQEINSFLKKTKLQ